MVRANRGSLSDWTLKHAMKLRAWNRTLKICGKKAEVSRIIASKFIFVLANCVIMFRFTFRPCVTVQYPRGCVT